MLSVAIFAYNEEEAITAGMQAVVDGGLGPDDRAYVLINGTRDRTMEKVNAFAAKDPRFSGVDIPFGDKANAWDVYVQKVAPLDAGIHVFVDGDVRICPGSIDLMRAAFDKHPEAIATAGLPRGGRRSAGWAERVMKNHGMPGNFYALRGSLVQRMRGTFWMPVGLIGDDTFLRNMVLRDIDPQADPVKERIRPVAGAWFDYDSFPINSLDGVKALWRRHNRYALREAQMHILMRRLSRDGLSALPRRIDEIYGDFDVLADLRQARVGFGPRRALFPIVIPKARRDAGRDLGPGVWYDSAY